MYFKILLLIYNAVGVSGAQRNASTVYVTGSFRLFSHRGQYRGAFPGLYGRPPLVICFICSSVYMLTGSKFYSKEQWEALSQKRALVRLHMCFQAVTLISYWSLDFRGQEHRKYGETSLEAAAATQVYYDVLFSSGEWR